MVCCGQHPLSVGADSVIVNKLPLPNHPHSLIPYHVQIIASKENGTSCKKTCFRTKMTTIIFLNVRKRHAGCWGDNASSIKK